MIQPAEYLSPYCRALTPLRLPPILLLLGGSGSGGIRTFSTKSRHIITIFIISGDCLWLNTVYSRKQCLASRIVSSHLPVVVFTVILFIHY